MIGNEPTLITSVENPDAALPEGEPVSAPPASGSPYLCDPQRLLECEKAAFVYVRPGDFVRCSGWTRPRYVELVEQADTADDTVLFLREHDTSRANKHGIRRVDYQEWHRRHGWVHYPNLRQLWSAAHGRP